MSALLPWKPAHWQRVCAQVTEKVLNISSIS